MFNLKNLIKFVFPHVFPLYGGGSSGGGGSSTQTSTSRNEPWAPAQPYIQQGYKDAAKLYSQGPAQYTPWSQVAQMNGMQNDAINATDQYVNAPGTQQYMNQASGTVQNLLGGGSNPFGQLANYGQGSLGGYLSGNSMADPSQGINRFMYQNTNDPSLVSNINNAMGQSNGSFDALRGSIQNSGGFGQGIADQAHQVNSANTANSMLSSAYDTQNANRLNATSLANNNLQSRMGIIGNMIGNSANFDTAAKSLGLSYYSPVINTPLTMLGALNQMGGLQQAQNQAQLTDASNRWNFGQNAAYDNLVKFRNMINPDPSWGSTTTIGQSTTPQQGGGNMLGGALGGAASGASMGSMFGPWGAAIGGVAGGALGAFSSR